MSKPSLGGRVVERILELLDAAGKPTLEDEARAIADAYGSSGSGPLTGTTHVSVVDASGMAAALSSTLGSGSGIFRGGTQLNNMLGELDVIGPGEHPPGERLASMMTPTLVLEEGRLRLVIGSAGSVRLVRHCAGDLAHSQGAHVSAAIHAPRASTGRPCISKAGGSMRTWRHCPPWDVVAGKASTSSSACRRSEERRTAAPRRGARGGVGVIVE
jgi:gamma-glutamyltranspeptidase